MYIIFIQIFLKQMEMTIILIYGERVHYKWLKIGFYLCISCINIWDVWSHQNTSGHCSVDDCINGDVACNSYRQIDDNIANINSVYIKVI